MSGNRHREDSAPRNVAFVCDPDPRRLGESFLERLAAELARAPRGTLAPHLPVLVVTPTARLRDHLTWLTTQRLRATAGVEFLLHRDLAERVLRNARQTVPQALPAAWLRALATERLAAVDVPLARYLAAQPSALAPLLATFRDLRDAGLDHASLARIGPRLGATARDTIALFREFEALQTELESSGFGDSASATRLALTAPALPAQSLLHYGAYELVGATRALVARTQQECGGAFFVPTSGADRASVALHAALDPAAAAAAAAATAAAATTPAPSAWPHPARCLRQSAATPRDELRFALRQLLAWHHRDGIPFEELAILVRSPSGFEAAATAEAALLDLTLDTSFETPFVLQGGTAGLALALRHLRSPSDRVLARAARRQWHSEWPAHDELAQQLDRATRFADRIAIVRGLLAADDPAGAALDAAHLVATRLAETPFATSLPAARTGAIELLLALLDEAAPRPAGGTLRLLELHQSRALPLRRAVWIGANDRLLPRPGSENFFLPDADRAAITAATGRPLARHADSRADEELLADCAIAAITEELVVSWARSDGERDLAPSPWIDRLAPGAPTRALSRHPLHQLTELHAATGMLAPNEALLLRLPPGGAPAGGPPSFTGPDAPTLARAFDRARATESFDPDCLDWDGEVGPITLSMLSPSRMERLGRCPLQHFFADVLRVQEPDEEPTSGELPTRLRGTLFHRALEELCRARFSPAPPRPPPFASPEHAAFLAELEQDLAARFGRLLRHDDFVGALAPALMPLRIACWSRELARFVTRDWSRLAELGIASGTFEEPACVDVGAKDWPLWLRMRFDRVLIDGSGGEIVGDYKSARSLAGRASLTEALRGNQLALPLYGLARLALSKPLAGLELYSLHPRATASSDDSDGGGDGGNSNTDERDWLHELDVAKLLRARDELVATLETLDQLRTAGSFPLVADRGGDRGPCGSCAYALACRHAHGPTRARAAAAADHRDWYALAAKKAQR